MKKSLVLMILMTFLITSCNSTQTKEKASEYEMTCEKVGSNVLRCENKETICYGSIGRYSSIMGDTGLACKFKDNQ